MCAASAGCVPGQVWQTTQNDRPVASDRGTSAAPGRNDHRPRTLAAGDWQGHVVQVGPGGRRACRGTPAADAELLPSSFLQLA